MVFLSPLADRLERFWETETKNRGARALASLVEALDELVHHHESQLDKEQKKQVTACVRQLRRRASHVRASRGSISGSSSSSEEGSDSGSDGGGAGDDLKREAVGRKRKKKRASQQAMMRSAVRDALGDDYAPRGSMSGGFGNASAIAASLDADVGKSGPGVDVPKRAGSPAPDDPAKPKASPGEKKKPSFKGAIKKISLGLKLKRALGKDSEAAVAASARSFTREEPRARAAAAETGWTSSMPKVCPCSRSSKTISGSSVRTTWKLAI